MNPRKRVKPNENQLRSNFQPPYWQQYQQLCFELTLLNLRSQYPIIIEIIRSFYIARFPEYKPYLQQYNPVTYYTKTIASALPVFRVLPILYSTFFIMCQVKNTNKIAKNHANTTLKQFLIFNRQVLTQHIRFFVYITDFVQAQRQMRQWMKKVYFSNQPIGVAQMFPMQITIRGIVKKFMNQREQPVTGVSVLIRIPQPQDFSQLANYLFQATQVQNFQHTKERLKDQLNQQQLTKYLINLQRTNQWIQIKTLFQGIKVQVMSLLFFARDYIYSCNSLNYRNSLKNRNQFQTAFICSISVQTTFVTKTSFIWVNIPPFQIYQADNLQKIQKLTYAILISFIRKLALHSNYYAYELTLHQQIQTFTNLRMNCAMSTRLMFTPAYYTNPENILTLSGLQRTIFFSGASKQFDDRVKVVVRGTFYLYSNPRQDCFKQLVQRLVQLTLLRTSDQQRQRMVALKDPFVVSQICQLPIVCSSSRSFSNVSTAKLKQHQRYDPQKMYCILIFLGHVQVAKMVPKKKQKTSQYIWSPLRQQKSNIMKKIQQQNKIVKQYYVQLQRKPVQSGKSTLINLFSSRYFHGIGFMDIQTLVVNNVIQSSHNVVYLACIVYWDPSTREFQQQKFDWFQYQQSLPQKLVKRMLDIARQFYQLSDRSKSFYWQTFNGIQFDYFILRDYFIKSLICLGSFGDRTSSKGFYTNQMKLYDARTIYNRGSLKVLTKNQFYKKIDLDIKSIKTIQDYKQNKQIIDKYCFYDCKSLMQLVLGHYCMFMEVLLKLYDKYKVADRYYQFIHNPRNLLSSFTASSQSMYILRQIFFPYGLLRLSLLQSIEKHRQFIFGGMVQVLLHLNRIKQILFQLDIIGMYSAIMMKPLPYVELYRIPFQQLNHNLQVVQICLQQLFQSQRKTGDIIMFVLKDIQLLTRYPFIPVRLDNGGLIYPNCIQKCLLPAQQLEYLINNGLIASIGPENILQVIRYRTKLTQQQAPIQQPIKTCVQQLVQLRKYYKKKMKQQPNNPQHQLKSDFCKLQINSISGKFMMRFFPSTLISHPDHIIQKIQRANLDLDQQRQIFDQQQQQGPQYKVTHDYTKKHQPFIGDLLHIGAYITSSGRFQIFKALNQLQKKKIQPFYTDTDSVFVCQQGLKILKQKGLVGQNFGDLECKNNPFEFATFINRKCYILLKRLPKQFQSKTLQQFSKMTKQQQQKFIVQNFDYKFQQQQIDKFFKCSPMTTYVLKKFAKIGFKGFSIIPHWTQLCAIQYSFVVTLEFAKMLYLQPHKQNSLPILNRKYLQILLKTQQLYCNRLFQYRSKLQASVDAYVDIFSGMSKKEKKQMTWQPTTMVVKKQQFDSVNFMSIWKVLNLNAKRIIEGNITVPYQRKQQFEGK